MKFKVNVNTCTLYLFQIDQTLSDLDTVTKNRLQYRHFGGWLLSMFCYCGQRYLRVVSHRANNILIHLIVSSQTSFITHTQTQIFRQKFSAMYSDKYSMRSSHFWRLVEYRNLVRELKQFRHDFLSKTKLYKYRDVQRPRYHCIYLNYIFVLNSPRFRAQGLLYSSLISRSCFHKTQE